MDQEEAAYALKHFGVKGMHWGVRKEHSSEGESGSAGADHKNRNTALVVGGVIAGGLLASKATGAKPVLTIGLVAAGTAFAAQKGKLPVSTAFSSSERQTGEKAFKR